MRMAVVTLSLVAASCQPQSEDRYPCTDLEEPLVCTVPFEAIYSDRKELFDHLISLDGVLGVATDEEPPGSRVQVYLLFSTLERARLCRPQLAIELIPGSVEMEQEMKLNNGAFVSVEGILRPSQHGLWAELELVRDPMLMAVSREEIPCLSKPPPPPVLGELWDSP